MGNKSLEVFLEKERKNKTKQTAAAPDIQELIRG